MPADPSQDNAEHAVKRIFGCALFEVCAFYP